MSKPKPTLYIDRWLVCEPPTQVCKQALILLPGRGCPAEMMVNIGQLMKLPETLLVAFETRDYAWYPRPHDAKHQANAVLGLPVATTAVEQATMRVLRTHDIPLTRTAVLGFSAGAVVAIKIMETVPFMACVSMSGAALEPEAMRLPADPQAKFFVQHNANDPVFAWDERYLPMRQAMRRLGLRVHFEERPRSGGHTIYNDDVKVVAKFLKEAFGLQ